MFRDRVLHFSSGTRDDLTKMVSLLVQRWTRLLGIKSRTSMTERAQPSARRNADIDNGRRMATAFPPTFVHGKGSFAQGSTYLASTCPSISFLVYLLPA